MNISVPDNLPRNDDVIGDILKNYKTIAVVGLSSNPRRPSFSVTQYMQSAGYRIIPVNPNETEVLGEKSYPRLEDIPQSHQHRNRRHLSPLRIRSARRRQRHRNRRKSNLDAAGN